MTRRIWHCIKSHLRPYSTHPFNYTTLLRYLQIEKNSRQETKQCCYFFLYFLKVATNWQLVILLFRKSRGENKSQICDFSRYFSRKGNKFSRNCDCIGRNFEAWLCNITDSTQTKLLKDQTTVCVAWSCFNLKIILASYNISFTPHHGNDDPSKYVELLFLLLQ